MIALPLLALAAACAAHRPAPGVETSPGADAAADTAAVSFIESGFLTCDYSRLVPVKPGAARHVYENPDAPFSNYDKIFFDRVTIWRDQDQKEVVENADFQRVVDDLYAVASREFGKTFTLVKGPGPRVARLRVGLVAIDHPDDRLDCYVSHGEPSATESDEALPAGLREFGRKAWLEAEMLDSVSKEPVFAVVDRAADVIPRAKPVETWRDLHEAFEAWAKQAAQRVADLKSKVGSEDKQ